MRAASLARSRWHTPRIGPRRCTGLSLALLLVIVPLPAAASIDVDMPLMPNTEIRWVARDIALQGVPASIRTLRHASPLAEVVAYYRDAWSDEGEVQEHTFDDLTVLSVPRSGHFVSLQLTAGTRRTDGVLVISVDPLTDRRRAADELPLPPGLIRVSHQMHRDGGRRAETLTLASRLEVGLVRTALITAYETDGWRTLDDRAARSMQAGHVLGFARNGERLQAIVGRDPRWGDSTLVLVTRQPGG